MRQLRYVGTDTHLVEYGALVFGDELPVSDKRAESLLRRGDFIDVTVDEVPADAEETEPAVKDEAPSRVRKTRTESAADSGEKEISGSTDH